MQGNSCATEVFFKVGFLFWLGVSWESLSFELSSPTENWHYRPSIYSLDIISCRRKHVFSSAHYLYPYLEHWLSLVKSIGILGENSPTSGPTLISRRSWRFLVRGERKMLANLPLTRSVYSGRRGRDLCVRVIAFRACSEMTRWARMRIGSTLVREIFVR